MVIDNVWLSWIQGATENKSSQSTYMPLGHVALQRDSCRKQPTLTQATSVHKELAIFFLKQRFFSILLLSKSSQSILRDIGTKTALTFSIITNHQFKFCMTKYEDNCWFMIYDLKITFYRHPTEYLIVGKSDGKKGTKQEKHWITLFSENVKIRERTRLFR